MNWSAGFLNIKTFWDILRSLFRKTCSVKGYLLEEKQQCFIDVKKNISAFKDSNVKDIQVKKRKRNVKPKMEIKSVTNVL